MKNITLLALSFFILFILSSCHKTLPVVDKPDHEVASMNDLIVSDNFNWKTTKDIQVIIELPAYTANLLPVSISDESGNRLFFTGYPQSDETRLVTRITIPSYLNKLKLIFPEVSGKGPVVVSLTGNNLFYNLTQGQKSIAIPCDLSGFLTYSQGGWGSPAHGNNPGAVRNAYFASVFPGGLDVGDPSNYTMHFSTAQAIQNFLPGGGPDNSLSQNLVDPTNSYGIGNWAAQIVAAEMNIAYDEAGFLGSGYTDLKNLKYWVGPFSGMTISDFMIVANTALGGGSTSGYSYNQIGYAAEQINLAFDGYDHNYFTCSGGGGGGGNPNPMVQYEGTLAFEDLWPWKGDYDFNDLVVTYDFDVTKNPQEIVEHIKATFVIYAIGAYFHNGFGFSFPGVSSNDIVSVTGSVLKPNSVVTISGNGLEAGQPHATIIVSDDVYDIMPHPGMGVGVNTEIYSPYVQPVAIEINMDFAPGAVSFTQLDIGNFNPFLFIDQTRGVEVHLPEFAPTSLADQSLIGSGEDVGNQGTSHFYKTGNNLPWAINIPELFEYPIEKHDITTVYNHFAEWAESNGVSYPDWYKDLPGYRNQSSIYTHN